MPAASSVGLECDSLSFSGSFDLSLTLAAPTVPALSPSLVALLALGLAVTGAAALRGG